MFIIANKTDFGSSVRCVKDSGFQIIKWNGWFIKPRIVNRIIF